MAPAMGGSSGIVRLDVPSSMPWHRGASRVARPDQTIAMPDGTTSGEEETWFADRVAALVERGQISAAMEQLEGQLETEDPVQLLKAADSLDDVGESDLARRAAEAVVRRFPDLWLSHLSLGRMALDQEDLPQAIESLSASVALKPWPATLSFLGFAYIQHGNEEAAIAAYRQALEIDPHYEEASYNLATLLVTSDPVEAKSLFRAALHEDPEYGIAHREFGKLLNRQGVADCAAAEKHLRRAVELMPNDPWALLFLGNCLYTQGRRLHALAVFKQAARVFPGEPTPLWCAADIHHSLGNLPLAIEFNQRALELDPEDPSALANMGRCMLDSGESDEAREYLERAATNGGSERKVRRLLVALDEAEREGR